MSNAAFRTVAAALIAASVWSAPAATLAEPDAERAAELERLVRQDCGSCHGLTLKGGLGPALTPAALEGAEAAGLAAVILDGAPQTPMPPWRPLLTEEEAQWIAQYLLNGGVR